jgi:hypothetical protein
MSPIAAYLFGYAVGFGAAAWWIYIICTTSPKPEKPTRN